jgi:hypothetical protein
VLLAEAILILVLLYLTCGLLVGVPFIAVGAGRLDSAARATSLLFRLFILPGVVVFWPLLAVRWARTYRQGGEP